MIQEIKQFSFWTPALITPQTNPGTTTLRKAAWYVGSFADMFASFNSKAIYISATPTGTDKFYFNEIGNTTFPLIMQALKVAIVILPVFIAPIAILLLPITLLFIKVIYKTYLDIHAAQTIQSPNTFLSERLIGKTKIVLLQGDLTKDTADVIVNAANENLKPGSGVCGAIRSAAGKAPFDNCAAFLLEKKVKKVACGSSMLTTPGNLKQIKAIAHTVGPDYRDSEEKKQGKTLLSQAYQNSLEQCLETSNRLSSPGFIPGKLQSIAFPSISTGIFEAPLDESSVIALETIRDFIHAHPDALEEVRMVFRPQDKDNDKKRYVSEYYLDALADLEL